MKRYILDSGIITDLINRRNRVHEKAAEVVRQGHRLGIGSPVLGEFLAGLENSASRKKNVARFERALKRLTLWAYDESAARAYASDLRRRGIAIQQIDMQTAAIAFALGQCVVVTKDTDFDDIPGLEVENWATS